MTTSGEAPRNGPCAAGQSGAVTLVTTFILLFCMSLIALYTSRVVVTEQRLAANDVRARQAFAAAQAGLATAFGWLSGVDRGVISYDGQGWAELAGPAATFGDGMRFVTRVDNRQLLPHRFDLVRIVSRGFSGDGSSRRVVEQKVRWTPRVPNLPRAPLVAGGEVRLRGHVLLGNPVHPVAAWGGAQIVLPDTVEPAPERDTPCPPRGICDRDPRLRRLSRAAFFVNFFGRSREQVRAAALPQRCHPCAGRAAGAPLLWIGPARDDRRQTVSMAGAHFGTREEPVVVVAAGDLRVTRPSTVNGLLYIGGDWLAGTGELIVNGAIIIEGAALGAGPATLTYDPAIMAALSELGDYVWLAGSWTDF